MGHIIDPEYLSQEEIKQVLIEFVQSKTDYASWKDFYESNTGTTFIELLANFGSYNSYHTMVNRRENYLFDAKIRSSHIATSESLGYSVFRGKNDHLKLTFTANSNIGISKFDTVGTAAGYDLVSNEDKNVVFGETVTIEVIVGNKVEESITVSTEDIIVFRYLSEKVSEDFVLTLNDSVLPTSKLVVDMTRDKYITLTNSLSSLDVLYFNRFPPEYWIGNKPYNPNEFITPNYAWRSSFTYSEDSVAMKSNYSYDDFYYKCITIGGGESGTTEPVWPVEAGQTIVDGAITWECVGVLQGNIYFQSITSTVQASGNTEPDWPINIGAEITEGLLTWKAVRSYEYSNFPYRVSDELKLTFIELVDLEYSDSDIELYYGTVDAILVENRYVEPETMENIKVNAPLFHETQKRIRGRYDYLKSLKLIMDNVADTNGRDITPAVVGLTYCKEHTTLLWENSLAIKPNQQLMPSIPNNYIYTCISAIEGYTHSSTYGLSDSGEPTWPTTLGEQVTDFQIVWEAIAHSGVPDIWEADTEYNQNTIIQPTVFNGFMYIPAEFNTEPVWPVVIGSTIIDGDLEWECTETIFLGGYYAPIWKGDQEQIIGDYIIPSLDIGFFYRCSVAGITDIDTEPTWPMTIGNTVVDGTVTWTCHDETDSDLYPKNLALEELKTFRPFGVEPPFGIDDPTILFTQLDMVLYLSDYSISIDVIRTDIDAIIESYEKILSNAIDYKDIEEQIEELSYMKIARITINQENKSNTWVEGTEYHIRDLVFPPTPNGFVYLASFIRGNVLEGYSQWIDKGYSSNHEPIWPTTLGLTIVETHLEWTCETLVGTPDVWEQDVLYPLDTIVQPSTPTGFQYRITDIVDVEPNWPTEEDEVVVDGEIYWKAKDPSTFIPWCNWKEYYIFGKNIIRKRG